MTASFAEEYYTEAGRLESFRVVHPLPKRRGSNTNGRGGKSMKWPHAWLVPEQLAEAGFFYVPAQGEPDNVRCFLCQRSICGWEVGDNPFLEHLKLAPDCGWAITSCVEARIGGKHLENPMSPEMVNARIATFGDRWPHEGKKGWKCKTKQLVEAGWFHKPTPESDDFAECAYCTLALDGWESADKPFNEHHARSQDCSFFTLCKEWESSNTKQAAKGRKPRASRGSRVSTQSALEGPSLTDVEAEEDDSMMTAASTTSQLGRKLARGKKATTRGRKLKDEPVEVAAEPEPEEDVAPAAEQAEARSGKKRLSDDVGGVESVAAAPSPPAKRRTRSSAVQGTILPDLSAEDAEIAPPKPAAAKKTRGRASKATRKTSTASRASPPARTQNDDMADEKIEADLNRQLAEMEDPVETAPDVQEVPLQKAAAAPTRRATRTSKVAKADDSVFSAAEEYTDAAPEAAPAAVEADEPKPLPKARGKAGQAKKGSAKQQAAAKRAAEAKAEAEAAAAAAAEEKAAEEAAAAELAAAQAELAQARAEAEAYRAEREEARRVEEERIEAERLEAEAEREELEAEAEARRAEEERAEEERRQAEAEAEVRRVEEERVETERLEAEAEREELEAEAEAKREEERVEGERQEAEAQAEARRVEEERAEAERQEAEARRAEWERQEAEARRAEWERQEAEAQAEAKAEAERVEIERQEAEAAAEQIETELQEAKQRATKPAKGKGGRPAKAKQLQPPPTRQTRSSARSADDSMLTASESIQEDTNSGDFAANKKARKGKKAASHKTDENKPESSNASRPAKAKGKEKAVAEPTPTPEPSASSLATPTAAPSSARPARQEKALTPSPSLQSSDAENRPPSSHAAGEQAKAEAPRVPLAATPSGSPSRQNVVAGLRSMRPWTEIDLDEVFAQLQSPETGQEKAAADSPLGSARKRARRGELASPEREMTVEDWVKYNAGLAEEKLRRDCERMVDAFEREGERAMAALEGVDVLE